MFMFVTCVFWFGICRASAILLWSKLSSRATRAPWTPDSIRLFEYSFNPMPWTHLIIRSFVQTNTSSITIKRHITKRHIASTLIKNILLQKYSQLSIYNCTYLYCLFLTNLLVSCQKVSLWYYFGIFCNVIN